MVKLKDLTGQRFGKLVVLKREDNSWSGSTRWLCICDCGNNKITTGGNLRNGNAKSCGCLVKESAIKRSIANRKQPKICSHKECLNTIEKGGKGLCGKHAQRMRRHGDTDYITPKSVGTKRLRQAQLARVKVVKKSTYRKYMGRHEHRVVAEKMIGRRLNSGEVVHHIDDNRHNNDPSNLQVVDRIEHIKHHANKRKGRVNVTT